MRIAILGERNGWHVGQLADAIAARGHAADVVSWQSIRATVDAGGPRVAPEVLAAADVVAVRGMPGVTAGADRLEEVIFRMDALAQLEAAGMPVVNRPRALEIAIDKFLTLAMLARAGLRVPPTRVVQGGDAAHDAWLDLGGDCVCKPIFGSRGRGVVRIRTSEEALALAANGLIYLQEFVPHPGWDLRALVVGDEIFAMRRIAAAGEWRTNISLGGRPAATALTEEMVALARRAASTVGVTIAGVDILPSANGPVVLEVNAVPAWRGLQTVVAASLADRIAAEIERASATPQAGPGTSV